MGKWCPRNTYIDNDFRKHEKYHLNSIKIIEKKIIKIILNMGNNMEAQKTANMELYKIMKMETLKMNIMYSK